MMAIQMQQNNRDKNHKRKEQKKWLKNYLKLRRFLDTPKGKKQALNALERELKKDVIESQKEINAFIEEQTPFYNKFCKTKSKINKAVDEGIFKRFGFVKRPTFLDISDRTLDRNVFRYIEEIRMAKLVKEKYSTCVPFLTNLKCNCVDWRCSCQFEDVQNDLAQINDYHEYVSKGGKDPIRLMELLYNCKTYEGIEACLQLLSKDNKPRKKRTEQKTKEPLGAKPVSIQRLQYEAQGYYSKECEICGQHITIKRNGPFNDDNRPHVCEDLK